MAGNQYVSSVKYAAVPIWTAATTLAIGAFRRQTAPTDVNARVFRVSAITTGITGGTEPTWNVSAGVTTTDSGVTWTEVTGNPTYNWSAPHKCIQNAVQVGWASPTNNAFVYVDSNHNYTVAGAINWTDTSLSQGALHYYLSVNAAGAIPPGAADLLPGAKETTTGANIFTLENAAYVDGISIAIGSGAVTANANIFDTNGSQYGYWRNATIELASTGSASLINVGNPTTNSASQCDFFNIVWKFGASGQSLSPHGGRITIDGGSVAGAPPASFITQGVSTLPTFILMRGIDLSVLTGNIFFLVNSSNVIQVSDCKLNATVTRTAYANTGNAVAIVDFINCNSAAVGYNRTRDMIMGSQIIETTNVRASGASDGTTAFSWKIVTNNTPQQNQPYVNPFLCPPVDIWNTKLTPITVTLNVLSSTTLKDNEIGFDLFYLGSGASPLATIGSTIANVLSSGTNLTSGSFGWVTSGVGTPVQQQCAITITPAMVGMLRIQPKVLKASQTVWIDPMPVVV